jgi:hypothetical protein
MCRALFLKLSALVLLGACDYVDRPVERPGPGGGGGEGTKRRVLLEEFTGHRCSTCPSAHAVAAQLDALHGEDLIVVGIHATETFAAPLNPPAADGRYSTDFRTPAGDAYATQFGVMALPTGMVSRKPYNGSITVSKAAWSSAIADLIGQDALFDIWFSQLTFNPVAGTANAEVKVAVLANVSGAHNLTVYLLEDHVIDWQLNAQASPPDIPNYDHRHVLRGAVNGTWGTTLFGASASAGDTLTLNLPAIPVNPAWNPANCSLVAYVYRTDTYEVLQAVERKFQP